MSGVELDMLKVGDYVRTECGTIGKFKRYAKEGIKQWVEIVVGTTLYTTSTKAIAKHSKNIIDLIEVGDIVEMCNVLNEDVVYIWDEEMLKAVKEDINDGIRLGAILTKEQYEQTKYKV